MTVRITKAVQVSMVGVNSELSTSSSKTGICVRLQCLDSMTVTITEAVRLSMVGIVGGLSSSKTGINLHNPCRCSSIIIAKNSYDNNGTTNLPRGRPQW
jgi:hypothetical protein